jgi:hypothetical protein
MEMALSVTTVAGLIWVARVLLPRAVNQDERFPLVSAVLTLVLAIVLWFLVGVPTVF